MLDIEQVQEELKTRSLSVVSMDTRITYNQLWRLRKGQDTNPQYKTLKAISDYLERTK
jgi:hypothetical protein